MTKERRKASRHPILDTFSFFVIVPKKGVHRLSIHDLSKTGIGFDLDTDGESQADFGISTGEELEIHLYLNQSLFIPLAVKIVRMMEGDSVRKVGGEFSDTKTKSYKALLGLLEVLDKLSDAAHINPAAAP